MKKGKIYEYFPNSWANITNKTVIVVKGGKGQIFLRHQIERKGKQPEKSFHEQFHGQETF